MHSWPANKQTNKPLALLSSNSGAEGLMSKNAALGFGARRAEVNINFSANSDDPLINNITKELKNQSVANKVIDTEYKTDDPKILTIRESLNDPSVAMQVYQDKDVMNSLTRASIKLVDKQLLKTKDKEQAEKLTFVKFILSAGLEAVEKSEAEKKSGAFSSEEDKNLSFGAKGIWRVCTYWGGKNRKERVDNIINRNATAASAAAGALAQTVVGDKAALTVITTRMCKNISKEHGLNGLATGSGIIGCAVGFAIGAQAAATAITVLPGAGNAINASIAYTLHQVTGRSLNAIYSTPSIKSDLKTLNDTAKMMDMFGDAVQKVEAFHMLPEELQNKLIGGMTETIKTGINIVNSVTEWIP